ncbi:MAG TPA: hypothetical protein VID04_10485 [Methylomirabilota bacterium]
MPAGRQRLGLLLAGVVVVAGGFGIAIVEAMLWPRGTIWLVAGATVGLVIVIRALTAPRS